MYRVGYVIHKRVYLFLCTMLLALLVSGCTASENTEFEGGDFVSSGATTQFSVQERFTETTDDCVSVASPYYSQRNSESEMTGEAANTFAPTFDTQTLATDAFNGRNTAVELLDDIW